MKTCTKCKETKPLAQFYKQDGGLLGVASLCKRCDIKRKREWRAKNATKYKDYMKSWASNNRDKTRRSDFKKRWGITVQEAETIAELQDGKCAICGKTGLSFCSGKRKDTWALDHDHRTGKIRGLLCQSCNLGLGWFYDDMDTLENAIRYLLVHNET